MLERSVRCFVVLLFVFGSAFTPSAFSVEVKISGQINRLIMGVDNGNRSIVHHADNTNSGTRLELQGKQPLDNGITVGAALQWRVGTNRSDQVDITRKESRGVNADDFRRSEVWFSGKKWGRVFIGKGQGAANGITEMDLSGTDVISYARAHVELLGNIQFHGADFDNDGVVEDEDNEIFRGKDEFQVNNVARFIDSFDGLGYQDRVRYDTPRFGPFDFAVSFGQGDSFEGAVRIAERLGASRLAFAAGFFNSGTLAEELDSRFDKQFDFKGYGASVSWLADSGINLTAAYSLTQTEANNAGSQPVDGEHVYGKVGYRNGKHAFSIDLASGNSGYFDNSIGSESPFVNTEATTWGVAYVYNLVEGVELYGSYRTVSLEGIDESVEGSDAVGDITAWFGGTRVKF